MFITLLVFALPIDVLEYTTVGITRKQLVYYNNLSLVGSSVSFGARRRYIQWFYYFAYRTSQVR